MSSIKTELKIVIVSLLIVFTFGGSAVPLVLSGKLDDILD